MSKHTPDGNDFRELPGFRKHDETAAADSGTTRNVPRVTEILSWYGADNPGTLANLARLLKHGVLGGTGRLLILPVDQGFEHGPGRSFAVNPAAYDPRYHIELAIQAGCNAYAAPLGFLEAVAREYVGEVPLILKINSHDLLGEEADPTQAVTASVADALRLGCIGIGFTIYPGSGQRFALYEQLRVAVAEAKRSGLIVVVWSYPRGSGLSKDDETALDVTGYAAHIAAQLGAHVIKVKLPTPHLAQTAARSVYTEAQVPRDTLALRVCHIMQCAFDGRRIVVFSGGPTEADEALLDEIRAIRDGGGFGSIIGRNAFQRPKQDALRLLSAITDIYRGDQAS